jgi:hypothetical protein
MYDLRFIHVCPAKSDTSAAGDDLRLAVAMSVPSFRNGLDADSVRSLREALREGWEPFSTVSTESGVIIMWMRRPVGVEGAEIKPQDLPGQYL